jgi:hypothetical protein
MPGLSEASMSDPKVTASDVRKAMLARWTSQEWAIMWEVAPATGAIGGKVRYADAVMMSLWPSRGIELHGVEIKVSRSDWKREAADPTKAELIAAYCERWWVHVAPGVIHDLSEVPPAWGVREFDGKKWHTLREAEKTEAKPCDRSFLASLLRRADEVQRAIARREAEERHEASREALQKERDAIESRVTAEVERRTKRFSAIEAQVKAFEEASGISLYDFGLGGTERASRAGALVRAIEKVGTFNAYNGLAALAIRIRKAADEMDAALLATGLETEPKDAAA